MFAPPSRTIHLDPVLSLSLLNKHEYPSPRFLTTFHLLTLRKMKKQNIQQEKRKRKIKRHSFFVFLRLFSRYYLYQLLFFITSSIGLRVKFKNKKKR